MKFKEELSVPKEEVGGLTGKSCELTDEELEQISGGFTIFPRCAKCGAFHPVDQPCPKPLI